MSIIAKFIEQFSRRGGVCIRTLRCARPGAGKMLRDSDRERGAVKFIFLGQSTVCERAWYNSVLHTCIEGVARPGGFPGGVRGSALRPYSTVVIHFLVLYCTVYGMI